MVWRADSGTAWPRWLPSPARRAASRTLTPAQLARVLTRRLRSARVIATGDHLAAYAVNTRLRAAGRRHARGSRVFSVHSPLPELVDKLNRHRPALLDGYATVIALLADEQLAGRLRINPVVVSFVAEGLSESEHRRIRSAFGAHVGNTCGCNESLALGYGCLPGWPHIHSDWVILEPVDAAYRPTAPCR